MPTFDLFMSYNRVDRTEVQVIRQRLLDRGVSGFIDSEDLLPGLPWPTGIYNAIQNVQAVAVFIGKAGLSTWQKREWAWSIERQDREEKQSTSQFPVIPVLLPQTRADDVWGGLFSNTWVDMSCGIDDDAALDALVRAAIATIAALQARASHFTSAGEIAVIPERRLKSLPLKVSSCVMP